jgi:hypothetical protein
MMRQLSSLFAMMGNFVGGADVAQGPLRLMTMTITMRRRRRRRRTVVRSWEDKEDEGECKN